MCVAQNCTKFTEGRFFLQKAGNVLDVEILGVFCSNQQKYNLTTPKPSINLYVYLGLAQVAPKARKRALLRRNAIFSPKDTKWAGCQDFSRVRDFWQSGLGLFRSCVVKSDASEMHGFVISLKMTTTDFLDRK